VKPVIKPVKAVAKPAKAKAIFNIDNKLASIEKSKLSKSEKARYSAMLQNKSEEKSGIPFEVYASARNLSGGMLAGKKAMAKSKGKIQLSLKEWDDFFKKF